MINHTKPLFNVRLMVVSVIVFSMITACSGGNNPANQSQGNIQPAMAASGSFSAQVPKVGELAKRGMAEAAAQAQLKQPVLESAPTQSEPAAPKIPENLPLEPEQPLAAGLAEIAPAIVNELQNVVPPAVDLSLAIEPQVGFRAPDFSLSAVDGQVYRLGDLLGRNVVVNYWATWCVPCKQELPILEKLHREYSHKGVFFVSVNALDKDSLDKVQAAVSEFGMTFPVLLDQERSFANTYRALFFPTTFLIDGSGVIREISLGDNTEAELRTSLDKLLAGIY